MANIENIVAQLLKEIEEKKLFFDKTVDYYRSKEIRLNPEESLKLIEELMERGVFRWLHLIGYLLEETASLDSRFIDVLFKVMEKTNEDMAQGILIKYLVQIGISQPELAIKIYKKLGDMKQPSMLLLGCWMLGGAGKTDFEKISEIVREGLMTPNPETKVASLVALRVSFGEKMESQWKNLVFSLLEIIHGEPSERVKSELASVYIIFYEYNPEKCFSSLKSLAEGETGVRLNLSRLLGGKRLHKEHHFALLKILARSEENSILDNISLSIAFQSKIEDVDEGLSIIHEWLKDGKFYEIRSLPLALNKVGENDLDLCLKRIENWVKEENYKLRLIAPKIAVEFAKDNLKGLKDRLIYWIDDSHILVFSLETVRQLLEAIFERSNGGKNPSPADKEIITDLLKKLKGVARRQKLDPEKISKQEELNIYKCLILIEEIEKDYKELDYGKIWQNLERFPNIKRFLGEKWFKRMEKEENKTHPLLVFIAKDLLNIKEFQKKIEEIEKLTNIGQKRKESWRAFHSLESYAFLSHLDQELETIEGSRGLREIKAKLRKEEHFWKVFSEIDVIARLMQVFRVGISPRLIVKEEEVTRVKHPDLEVTINDTQVFVEVIAPEMFAPLRYFRTAGIPNRLRSKVTEELRRHFIGMEIDRDVLIVVDMGSSEINYSSIQDYVEGPLQFAMQIDKRTRKVLDTFVKRGKAMVKIDEEARQVIGIIGYRRIFSRTDGRVHLRGRSFLNPDVAEKKKIEILRKIAKSLLG